MWCKATFTILCSWIWLGVTAAAPTTTSTCPKDTVVVYKVVLETFWTEENFPKDYPQFRPKAHWSKLLGETHNALYHLWQLGVPVSEAFRRLLEHGEAKYISEDEQDSRVYDQFTTPAITNGAGISEAIVFVDDTHSKISAMARLIPSPDWFVGVDSYDMCFKSDWIDAVSVALHPMDSGISAGLTFTAPHWSQDPPKPVSLLTSDSPSHPASSFRYPGLTELPLIAALHIYKVREYSMSEMNNMTEVDASLDAVSTRVPETPDEAFYPGAVTMPLTDEDMPIAAMMTSNHGEVLGENRSNITPKDSGNHMDGSEEFKSSDDIIRAVANGRKIGSSRHLPRHFRHRLNEAINRNPGAECPVGPWSEWSACSRSCGLGERIRTRELRQPLPLHLPAHCSLVQRHFCGSARLCRTQPYFNW